MEYQTQLASSILLILKEGQNPKYAGPLGPYLCVVLIAVEVFAPLVSPYLEELIAHGRVNTVSFLNFNLPFVFSPIVTIPLSVQFAKLYISRNKKVVLPSVGMLDLENINGDVLTHRIWMFTQAIYCLASLC